MILKHDVCANQLVLIDFEAYVPQLSIIKSDTKSTQGQSYTDTQHIIL